MRKIAHRANRNGSNPHGENNPIDIGVAIAVGYDVEIDVWVVETEVYLGHDKPTHLVDETFLEDVKDEAWFHCKNIEALNYFAHHMPDAKYFWHQNDDYTLTSNGYIWTYPGKEITDKSIIVLTEPEDLSKYEDAYGVCTDYLEGF
jgi:hypothetical protein